MGKFLAGVLVTVALFNLGSVKRFVYDVTGTTAAINRRMHTPFTPKEGPAPRLATRTEVQEPDLDRMEELGFEVRR